MSTVVIYRKDTGEVVNRAVHSDDPNDPWVPGPGLDFEAAPDASIGVGWQRVGPGQYEPIPVPIETQRAEAVARVEAGFKQRLADGFTYAGVLYQIDPQSQVNIATYGARAVAVLAGVPGAAWPDNFTWIRADNQREPFSAAEFYAFSQAAQDYVTGLYYTRRETKDVAAVAADPVAAADAVTWVRG